MLYRIAALWGCSIREASDRLGTWEAFLEWCAYYSLEPWGEYRADLRSARVCQVIAAVNMKKNATLRTLDAFAVYPDPLAPRKRKTVSEAQAILLGASPGGGIIRMPR